MFLLNRILEYFLFEIELNKITFFDKAVLFKLNNYSKYYVMGLIYAIFHWFYENF